MINILRNLRQGKLKISDLDSVRTEHISFDIGTFIVGRNATAAIVNHRFMADLKYDPKEYLGERSVDFRMVSSMPEENLELKLGAKVIHIANFNGLRNGHIGTVMELHDNEVIVNVRGFTYSIIPYTWNQYKTVVAEGKFSYELTGSYTQMPLRIGWTITAHRAQGQQYDELQIVADDMFMSGQMYVALSRATKIGGLKVLGRIDQSLLKPNETVSQFLIKKCA